MHDLRKLIRKVIDTSAEPECGCEYQHAWNCDAMTYRNAITELETYLKEHEDKQILDT